MYADPSKGLEVAAAGLSQTLSEAVWRRTDPERKVTADLSGGCDSSTIDILAAENLPYLDAFMHYHPGIAVGDVPFARQIAAARPNIRLHLHSQSAEELPFAHMDRQPMPGVIFPCCVILAANYT
jgi:asparagine synthetase B (glutamine-hydrolysing)